MRNSWRIPVLVVFSSAMFTHRSLGQAPPNEAVQFKIHASATDPLSPTEIVITMNLVASEWNENVVGWAVTSVEFRQLGVGGAPDKTWIAIFPLLPTVDGLWWVQHADAMAPQLSEFLRPPQIEGIAVAQSVATENLNYSFEGRPYVPPPGGAPFAQTAALTYALALPDPPTPIKDGEDVPVESINGQDPS